MYQNIIIQGNLGSDAELKYLTDGTPVCNFSLASGRMIGKGNAETTWYRVTLFGKRAETLNQYLLKGTGVIVAGRLRPDENGNPRVFQRKDGTWGASYEVTATEIEFAGNKKGEVAPEEVPF